MRESVLDPESTKDAWPSSLGDKEVSFGEKWLPELRIQFSAPRGLPTCILCGGEFFGGMNRWGKPRRTCSSVCGSHFEYGAYSKASTLDQEEEKDGIL